MLDNSKEINQKLDILYDLLVDNFCTLEDEIKYLIANPQQIKNTNKFASLLAGLKKPVFITPILSQISLGEKGDSWLTDFLYAAIKLLGEMADDEEFKKPKNPIDKLGVWILENKGELAWKAAELLKFSYSEKAEKIQLKKLEETGDFFLTYVACIIGLLWYNKDKHIEMVRQIAQDERRDEKLREYCNSVIKTDK
jgi:hypothetical protein